MYREDLTKVCKEECIFCSRLESCMNIYDPGCPLEDVEDE